MKDKRLECGCAESPNHIPYDGAKPCDWPACLTEQEHTELLDELERDL